MGKSKKKKAGNPTSPKSTAKAEPLTPAPEVSEVPVKFSSLDPEPVRPKAAVPRADPWSSAKSHRGSKILARCKRAVSERYETQCGSFAMTGEVSQTSLCPVVFDRVVSQPGVRDPETWEGSICVCHIRAAKLVVKGNDAKKSMPREGLFAALQKAAAAAGVADREVAMAIDEAELREMIQEASKTASLEQRSAAPVEFVAVSSSALSELYDTSALDNFLEEESFVSNGGERRLCEVVGCPLANDSSSAHEQFWVAEHQSAGAESSTLLYPLSAVILPAPELALKTTDLDGAARMIQIGWRSYMRRKDFLWLMDARKKAELMARIRAANKIRGWWFWLWGDDIQWTMSTNKHMESEAGLELMSEMISTPVNPHLLDSVLSDSHTPPDVLGDLDTEGFLASLGVDTHF